MVDRSESSLAVVWNNSNLATYYDVQRSDAADGEYAIVATEVAALGLVDEGLRPDSVYYYLVSACNHLGCTEFSDNPVAGVTESDAGVDIPAVPKDVRVVRKQIDVFPDRDESTWTAVEGATYYEVYTRTWAGPWTFHSAPTTRYVRATRPAAPPCPSRVSWKDFAGRYALTPPKAALPTPSPPFPYPPPSPTLPPCPPTRAARS